MARLGRRQICETCTHLLPHEHDENGECLGCQRGRYFVPKDDDDPFAEMTDCPHCGRAVGTQEAHRCEQKGGSVGDWGQLDSERGR